MQHGGDEPCRKPFPISFFANGDVFSLGQTIDISICPFCFQGFEQCGIVMSCFVDTLIICGVLEHIFVPYRCVEKIYDQELQVDWWRLHGIKKPDVKGLEDLVKQGVVNLQEGKFLN